MPLNFEVSYHFSLFEYVSENLKFEKSNHFQVTFKLFLWNFQLIFEEVILSSLMKIIELHKVSKFEIFSDGIQIFSKTFFISNGRSHVIFTLRFCVWIEFEFTKIKMKGWKFGKVISFPLIQLPKSFKFHSISHNQSHNNNKKQA